MYFVLGFIVCVQVPKNAIGLLLLLFWGAIAKANINYRKFKHQPYNSENIRSTPQKKKKDMAISGIILYCDSMWSRLLFLQ